MTPQKTTWIFPALIVLLAAGILYSFSVSKTATKNLPTYFHYTDEETAPLRKLSSAERIETNDLYQWDKEAFDIVSKNTLITGFDANTSKIYAYLAIAERDAAYLSYNTKGLFMGSVDPVSREVLCAFFPSDCTRLPAVKSDEYSEQLAKVVMEKVKERIAKDDAQIKPYEEKIGPEYWDLLGRIGITDGSRIPWFLSSGSQFRISPPPAHDSAEFRAQVEATKNAVTIATEQQKQATVFWAGGPGTKTPPGQWLEIADTYMKEQHTDLSQALLVRSTLAASIADATIAVFDSKYTYWVRRPFMEDATIITIMPTPSHPSYPAGHSTLSSAAATVLNHFFPEANGKWNALAEEAGMSRIWGGIHYQMDHEQGKILGENVGKEAIRHLSQHQTQ